MEKEVDMASEIANPEAGAGLQGYKETFYNVLEDIFSWLSAHQSIALITILIVLGIIIWLILRAKKYRRQFENEVYIKKKEIGKKDALIEEQTTKLNNLQTELADQRGIVSEALLSTLSTLTGYAADQLPIFFRSLSQIGGNPLQMADSRAIATADGPRDDLSGMNDAREGSEFTGDLSRKNGTSEATAWDEDSSSENVAKEKIAPDGDLLDEPTVAEKSMSKEYSPEKADVDDAIASGSDSSVKDEAKGERSASDGAPEEAEKIQKT